MREYGPVERRDVDEVLISKLPDRLTQEQKRRKVHNLLQELRRGGSIDGLAGAWKGGMTTDTSEAGMHSMPSPGAHGPTQCSTGRNRKSSTDIPSPPTSSVRCTLNACANAALPAWASGARRLLTSKAVSRRPAFTTKSTSWLRSRQ